MTARVVTDYYGATIAVPDTCPNQFGDGGANSHVVVIAAGRDAAPITVYLTRAKADDLIDALIARNQEIDAAALTEQATQNPRPSASPVVEGRAQTAAKTAGAEPIDDGGDAGDQRLSPQDDADGHTRTTAAGPSTASSGPGRPTLASMLGNARRELLANSTLIGPAGGEDR